MKKVEQQKKAKRERKGEKRKWKNKSSFCHAKTQNTLQNLSTKQQQNKQKLHKTHTHEQNIKCLEHKLNTWPQGINLNFTYHSII
jgi:hypothetical protein